MAKGEQTQTTATKPTQIQDYRNLTAAATGAFNSGGFYDPSYAGGEDTRAGLTREQQVLQERMLGPQGVSTMALAGLEDTLGAYDPNNPALTGAIDAAASDVNRNLQENLLPGIGDSAGQAGQFGSTRHGIAEGIALRGASEQVGDMAARMRYDDMRAHQAARESAVGNMGSITAGIEYGAGGAQREEQSRLDDLFSRWEYESGVGLQDMVAYKSLISGDMGGKSTAEIEGGK